MNRKVYDVRQKSSGKYYFAIFIQQVLLEQWGLQAFLHNNVIYIEYNNICTDTRGQRKVRFIFFLNIIPPEGFLS